MRSSLVDIQWSIYAMQQLSVKKRNQFQYTVNIAIHSRYPQSFIIRGALIASWDSRETFPVWGMRSLDQEHFGMVITMLEVRQLGHFDDLMEGAHDIFEHLVS